MISSIEFIKAVAKEVGFKWTSEINTPEGACALQWDMAGTRVILGLIYNRSNLITLTGHFKGPGRGGITTYDVADPRMFDSLKLAIDEHFLLLQECLWINHR